MKVPLHVGGLSITTNAFACFQPTVTNCFRNYQDTMPLSIGNSYNYHSRDILLLECGWDSVLKKSCSSEFRSIHYYIQLIAIVCCQNQLVTVYSSVARREEGLLLRECDHRVWSKVVLPLHIDSTSLLTKAYGCFESTVANCLRSNVTVISRPETDLPPKETLFLEVDFGYQIMQMFRFGVGHLQPYFGFYIQCGLMANLASTISPRIKKVAETSSTTNEVLPVDKSIWAHNMPTEVVLPLLIGGSSIMTNANACFQPTVMYCFPSYRNMLRLSTKKSCHYLRQDCLQSGCDRDAVLRIVGSHQVNPKAENNNTRACIQQVTATYLPYHRVQICLSFAMLRDSECGHCILTEVVLFLQTDSTSSMTNAYACLESFVTNYFRHHSTMISRPETDLPPKEILFLEVSFDIETELMMRRKATMPKSDRKLFGTVTELYLVVINPTLGIYTQNNEAGLTISNTTSEMGLPDKGCLNQRKSSDENDCDLCRDYPQCLGDCTMSLTCNATAWLQPLVGTPPSSYPNVKRPFIAIIEKRSTRRLLQDELQPLCDCYASNKVVLSLRVGALSNMTNAPACFQLTVMNFFQSNLVASYWVAVFIENVTSISTTIHLMANMLVEIVNALMSIHSLSVRANSTMNHEKIEIRRLPRKILSSHNQIPIQHDCKNDQFSRYELSNSMLKCHLAMITQSNLKVNYFRSNEPSSFMFDRLSSKGLVLSYHSLTYALETVSMRPHQSEKFRSRHCTS